MANTNFHPELNAIQISTYILQQNIKREPPKFQNYQELEKISQKPSLSSIERFNLLMKTFKWLFPEIGDNIKWHLYDEIAAAMGWTIGNEMTDRSLFALDPQLKTYLETAIDEGYIRYDGDSLENANSTYLTLKGHQYIESLGHQLSDSDQIFVAMWFNDTTRQLYEAAIKPAIEQAGYKVMRIDDKSHNEKICDEIIAEIRKSKAIIADMTCGLAKPESWSEEDIVGAPRGGVFYEAGFAHGLGIPVIWTVNQEIADIENVSHFDVRQYNQIRWTEENLEEAKKEILNRIEATLGQGPHLEQK